jgi:alkylated DNA repair protein alkB family protein 1
MCSSNAGCTKSGKSGEKTELSETPFRLVEKKYKLFRYDRREAKRKAPPETDFTDVVDMQNIANNTAENQIMIAAPLAVAPILVHSFAGVPGLFFLPNFLSKAEQIHWASVALHQFSRSSEFPNNLNTLDASRVTTDYEVGMRWVTLGYKYDWTAKTYHRERKAAFPSSLSTLCKKIVAAVPSSNKGKAPETGEERAPTGGAPTLEGNCTSARSTASSSLFQEYFPQTAIVNYFPVGTMMMAHQDVSEESMDKPLVSISLGCTSVFLMGTDRREDAPHAFFLRSGDAVIFTGPSRTAFHSVPRILDDCPSFLSSAEPKMTGLRININVRQVYAEPIVLPDFELSPLANAETKA